MRIATDQEMISPIPNLLPTSREGRERVQIGFPTPLFNRNIAGLCTAFPGQGRLSGETDSGHVCPTPDRKRISRA